MSLISWGELMIGFLLIKVKRKCGKLRSNNNSFENCERMRNKT